MATQFRCPEGHLWDLAEFDGESDPTNSVGPIACPYCGTICEAIDGPPTLRDLQPSSFAIATPRMEFPGCQIIEQLGRGGMGVVYKARQIHTDRFVAIKVPGGTDLESACRFGAEAKAAARVQSPNIVQVFEVGQQDGRSFLIMEYCPGGSLADRLDGTPLPSRPVAALIEAMAQAIAAAHAAGVIHRDMKPANILLCPKPGSDPQAPFDLDQWICKITDFGLARRMDVDLGQTQSGAILGTPMYMSPEQATGNNREVGPAADIYALGVVLYELLTGRAPFRGTNALETLEQIRTTDPVPPARLRPHLPRDLETICLTCLQKDPFRRYISANALAEDLSRFLSGHPILARPTSRLEHWIKRARRNPAVTALAAVLFLVMLGAVGYGVRYQFRLQAQRDRARYHFEMSVRSIEEMLTEVAEEDLAPEPRAELKRKALLEKALRFYEELLRVETDDPGLKWQAARAARRVGDIQRLLGRHDDARGAYAQALERLDPLVATPAFHAQAKREQADCHTFLGELERVRGEPALAAECYQRALLIQSQLHAADPENAAYRQDLSRTHYNLGIVARHTGRAADALAELGEAARLLVGIPASDAALRHHRARIYLNLGPVHRAQGQLPEAGAACGEAVRLLDTLKDEFPLRVEYRFELSAALINQGNVHLSARDLPSARASIGRAKDLLEVLARDYPSTPAYRAELARACNSLSAIAFQAGDRDAAAELATRASQVWGELSKSQPNSAEYHGELGIAMGNLGRSIYKSRPADARSHLTRGIGEVVIALRTNPSEPAFRASFRQQARDLAGLLVRAGVHDAARRQATDLVNAVPGQPLGTFLAVCFLATCIDAINRNDLGIVAATEVNNYVRHAIALIPKQPSPELLELLKDRDCDPLREHKDFVATLKSPAHRPKD